MPKSQKRIKGGKMQIPEVPVGQLRSAANSADAGVELLQKFIKNIETRIEESQNTIKKSGLINPAFAGGAMKTKKISKGIKTVTKPVIKKPIRSATKPAIKPAVKSAVKPAVKSATKPAVKPAVKPVIKKRKSVKGGGGSDWISSVNSRGNSAAPDSYWGYPGELWFRQFNKTADYIPNSQLAFAAAPISTCPDNESD
jgi:hypothetical protein